MENLIHGFLENGERVIVIKELDKGFLVEKYIGFQQWDGDYDESPSGRPEYVDTIYKKEPVDVFAKSITEARDKITELNDELSSIRSAIVKATDVAAQVELDCKKIPALKHILDFIKGDYNYFVFPNDYREAYIKDKNVALDDGDKYTRDQRLLTLEGSTGGDLQWRMNQYRDGSGSNETVIPCKTMEDAIKALAEYFIKELEKLEKDGFKQSYRLTKQCDWLAANGWPVKASWLIKSKEIKAENKSSAIANAQRIYKQALSALNKAKEIK